MKKAVIAVITIPAVFIGLWLVAIPESLMIRHMEDALERQGMHVRIMGFSKGLLYNFSIRHMHVSTEKDFPIVSVSDLHAGIDFLSFLALRPQFDFGGIVNDGRVYGAISLRGQGMSGGRAISVNGNGVNINGIPALERLGIRGNGNLDFDFNMTDQTGEIRFSIPETRFEGNVPGFDFLPLDLIQSVRGSLTIGKTITVRSLTLEGRGVHARVQGNVRGNRLNMKIELMMDSSFGLEPGLTQALEPYRVSPGYYVIPFSHTFLSAPSVIR